MSVTALHRRGRRLTRWLARAGRDERGFTLIELLVASVAGIIVTTAMGAIVITTVHFNSNYTDRVDANQEGRTAMEKITQALNSSCVAASVAPIISGVTGPAGTQVFSDGTHLWFYSAIAPGVGVTDTATINPSLVEVYLQGNTLIETAYPWTSGTAPAPTNGTPWVFNANAASTFTLLPSVTYAAPTSGTGATGPIFQYYPYSVVTGSTGTISSTPYSTPLSSADAGTTAKVSINFKALPADNYNAGGRGSEISDSVVLRLTPASSQPAAPNSPCS